MNAQPTDLTPETEPIIHVLPTPVLPPRDQIRRRLNKTHLFVIVAIFEHRKFIDMPNVQGFRIGDGRTMYGNGVLEALQQAEYLTDENHLTPSGLLFILANI